MGEETLSNLHVKPELLGWEGSEGHTVPSKQGIFIPVIELHGPSWHHQLIPLLVRPSDEGQFFLIRSQSLPAWSPTAALSHSNHTEATLSPDSSQSDVSCMHARFQKRILIAPSPALPPPPPPVGFQAHFAADTFLDRGSSHQHCGL